MSPGKAFTRIVDTGTAAAIMLLALALYAPALRYDFAYDDKVRLLGDYLIFNVPFSSETFLKLFVSPTIPGDLYRPLSTLSFWLDGRLWGRNPAGFHLVNILLHGLAGILVSLVLREVTGSRKFSFCIALLFLCHPLGVESVASISGRPEILAALSGLISAFLALRTDGLPGVKKILYCLLSALFFFLALLSKESAVTFLLIIPLLVYWKKKEFLAIRLFAFTGHVLFLGCYFFLRNQALHGGIIPAGTLLCEAENPMAWQEVGALERLLPAVTYLGKYVFNIFSPVKLLVDYSLPCDLFFKGVYSPRGYAMALLAVVFLLCTLAARRKAYGVFGLWFFAAFLVTSNIFIPIGTVMGDRLSYLPLIGALGFAGGVVYDYIKSKAFLVTLFILVASLLSSLTLQRSRIWQNDTYLFLQEVREAPLNPRAHIAAGKELLITLGRREEAEKEFLKAVELDPSRVEALLFLASINCEKKNARGAAGFANKVLEYEPHNEEALNLLAGLTARCR